MRFLPTDDQLALQRGIRELLANSLPPQRIADGFDPGLWAELAQTGVFELRTELSLDLASATLVFEELGRACVPGPLVGTFLTAGVTEGPVTVVEPGGVPLLVTHLKAARAVLVLDDDGPRIVPADAVGAGEVAAPVDPLTPLHEITALPDGERVGDAATTTTWRREGALLTAALQVGIASRLTDFAADYAKQREQFGRTIGSFQAVKHLCADMFVRAELARAALHAAAVTLDDPQIGDPARAVAAAKLLADEAASANARACVQVHGGMGFTWEVPVHFYLKRAWLHAAEFGTADDHAEAVADLL